MKQAADKTNDVAGDGTTTATALAAAIVNQGMKNITAGANPLGIKRGIDAGVDAVVAEIKKMSKQIKGNEEIAQVATISAESSEIGQLIAEVMQEVGNEN